MRSGYLQRQFPEMKWKNTVNQQISSAQQVLDYLYLGYNVIQLDRSLNRNMDELKRIKEVVENFKNKNKGRTVSTCMLIMENCMPFCPFKRAHDDLQIYYKYFSYWGSHLGALSCSKWRNVFGKNILPRSGTDCFWSSINTFMEYAKLVDIFKRSGRLTSQILKMTFEKEVQFGWFSGEYAIQSYSEIIEGNLEPVSSWSLGYGVIPLLKEDINKVQKDLRGSFWMTDKAKILERKLKNCKNQGIVPVRGPWGTVPELLFEKKQLIPALQQLLTSYND